MDDSKREIIITNFGDFLHLKKYTKIYNLGKYSNIIIEEKFKEQFNSIANNIDKDIVYLNKFFLSREEYFQYHTKEYEHITFQEFGIYCDDMRDFCSEEGNDKVIELFRKRKVGITTLLHIYYSQLRTTQRTSERFIPFFIIDYGKLIELVKYKDLLDLLNFNMINLFVDYKNYNDFCLLIQQKIKEYGFNINKILIKIIKLFMEKMEEAGMEYAPLFIIDNFDPKYEKFSDKLKKLQKKRNFRLIFVYLLENKISNKIILDYLNNSKKESYKMKYSKNIYNNIKYLPNKYKKCFDKCIPSITNYLKVINC